MLEAQVAPPPCAVSLDGVQATHFGRSVHAFDARTTFRRISLIYFLRFLLNIRSGSPGRHVHSWYILLWLPVVPGSHGVFPRLCCIFLLYLAMKALSPSRISLLGRRSSAGRRIRRLYVPVPCHNCAIAHRQLQEGGVFAARLTFVRAHSPGLRKDMLLTDHICAQPTDYPLSPPFKMKFDPPLFHPNSESCERHLARKAHLFLAVYADGNVCISILHTPGDDPTMYEQASGALEPRCRVSRRSIPERYLDACWCVEYKIRRNYVTYRI